jgi:hypothetical protein
MHHIRSLFRSATARRLAAAALPAVSAIIALPHMWQVDPAALPAQVAGVSEALAELPSTVAVGEVASTTGRHLGFDTNVYPGDRALAAWKRAAPYEWVGYYLPAPCHKDATWSGKRERLSDAGWGMAVIYVGQQTWGRTPRPTSKAGQRVARSKAQCNADLVGTARGTRDGEDAVARTAAEGFPKGTVVFLDVERMERVPQAMRDYYRAWAQRVIADGRYRPGVYVHKDNAALVHTDLAEVFASLGVDEVPAVWVASGRNFSTDKLPTDVGHAFANVWQGMLDIVESHGGVRLPIDVNVAANPSPSEQYAVAAD